MPLLHLFVLAVVQGITEFLPISSSGHLVLTWEVLGSTASTHEQATIDIAVHVGTLVAVCGYFWRDIATMTGGLWDTARGRATPGSRLLLNVIVATIPLLIAGFALKDRVEEFLRDPAVIAWATLLFGILLFVADRVGMKLRRTEHMTWRDAIMVGLMQILAFIPGTSRSGITMTAGRLLGYERTEAARFSMLLAIPAILGAGTLAGLDVYESGNLALGLDALIAAAMAFGSALLAITLLMRWLQTSSFLPFVIYRLILGGLLLYLIYSDQLGAVTL